jgi:hypothetical protein
LYVRMFTFVMWSDNAAFCFFVQCIIIICHVKIERKRRLIRLEGGSAHARNAEVVIREEHETREYEGAESEMTTNQSQDVHGHPALDPWDRPKICRCLTHVYKPCESTRYGTVIPGVLEHFQSCLRKAFSKQYQIGCLGNAFASCRVWGMSLSSRVFQRRSLNLFLR